MQTFTVSMNITWTPIKEKLRGHYKALDSRSSNMDKHSLQHLMIPSPEHLSQGGLCIPRQNNWYSKIRLDKL